MRLICDITYESDRVAQFIFDGFPQGTARPLGNALRQMLLSAIEGAAVTAVQIAGARHAYDTLDGVWEDIPEILANLSRLEVKLNAVRRKRLTLHAGGDLVTAGDIPTDGDVAILNPQQPIATLNPGASLQIEIEKGQGFRQAGESPLLHERQASGWIPLSADFSPVKRVGYRIEAAGGDCERLVMHVTTNGTVSPGEAMTQAVEFLLASLDGMAAGDEGIEPLAREGLDVNDLREPLVALKAALEAPQRQREENISPEPPPLVSPVMFGNLEWVETMPDLLAIQRDSYRQFTESGLPQLLGEHFPIANEGGTVRLELRGYRLETTTDPETCLKQGKTYAASLILSLRLSTETTTHDVEVHLAEIPSMMEDGTFLIRGMRRVCLSQLHRSPGILFERSERENKSFARVIPYYGSWVEFEIEDETQIVWARLDRRKRFPATLLLRAYGVETDAAICDLFADLMEEGQAWIRRTLQDDPTHNREEALVEIGWRMFPEEAPDQKTMADRLQRMLGDPTRYDFSRVGRRQLDRKLGLAIPEEEHSLTRDDLAAILKRLLAVHNGAIPADDPASLTERRLRSVGELMQNQLRIGLIRIVRHAREKMDLFATAEGGKQGEEGELAELDLLDELVEPQFVRGVLDNFWENSELVQTLQQTNPLDELTHKRRVTLLGPGGTHRDRAPLELRQVHESSFGKLCPMETPEGPNVGLIATLANHAQVDEDGFLESSGHETQILGISASLIPLVEHDDPKRVLMGANMQRQAVPLLFPEPPLVQTGMEAKVARDSRAMRFARVDGRVVRADAEGVVIQAEDGTVVEHFLTKWGRSPQGTLLHQRPTVAPGQRIRANDPIADGPAIREGLLALGQNVLVAYMPWHGFNCENAIVISDRLVREERFTSVHIETTRVEARHTEAGLERLTPHLPGKTDEETAHLDERGIAQAGAYVRPNDVLVGRVSPRWSESRLSDLLDEEAVHYVNASEVVPPYVEGYVIRTRYLSRKRGDDLPPAVEEIATVEIALRREVRVGDKFANRHGNKGVVARIVPEADMPHLADGTPMDVLLNPLKIPARGTQGELLETQLGWVAHRLGQPIFCPPYAAPKGDQIRELLVRAELPEDGRVHLFDGRTGRPYDSEVLVGYQYLMKLIHLVEEKIHARAIGPYSILTQQPLGGRGQMGGQRLGEMEIWALEAYGATHTLHEMLTVKSNAASGLALYRRIVEEGEQALSQDLTTEGSLAPTFRLLRDCLRGLGIELSRDGRGVHIRLASPEQIRGWSRGEIRLEAPEDGDLESASLIELADPHAMGHVELAVPVAHVWYREVLGLLLDLPDSELERLLYPSPADAESAATPTPHHAVLERLRRLDLEAMAGELAAAIARAEDASSKRRLQKQLRLVRDLLKSGVHPEWPMLRALPMVPQAMRPTVPVGGSPEQEAVQATSDLNLLYRNVLYRNQRLRRLLELQAPGRVLQNEARLLQEAVDALLDNGRHGRLVRDREGRHLRSLADMLKGKPGLLRSNLLGTRVDYSGRSVIVPDPELRLGECGLPREMSLRLFEPFVIHELIASGGAESARQAKQFVDEKRPEAMEALEKVTAGRLVLLNRAPTLNRACFQAFKPVLTQGKAIRFHPLMCFAFNADFDGDQIAVHLPLSEEAQREARERLFSRRNLTSLSGGQLLIQPPPEIALGCQYLTLDAEGRKFETPMTPQAVQWVYERDEVRLHDAVIVRWKDPATGNVSEIPTTVGRVLFNRALEGLVPYVNEPVDRARLIEIVESVFRKHGAETATAFLDRLTPLGFRFAMQRGGGVAIQQGKKETGGEPTNPLTRQPANAPTHDSPESHFHMARTRRRELFDTTIKVTSIGYLLRKLAAVASHVVVTEEDCGTTRPRNPVQCEACFGVCAVCYGKDLVTGQSVRRGSPLGMIAVSALGESLARLPVEGVHRLAGLLEARAPLQIQGREVSLAELLAEEGVEALHAHLLQTLQEVYREQGFAVDARHFEVVIRQMLSQVSVTDPGDTPFAEGELVSRSRLEEANTTAVANGGRPAAWECRLLGITKVALASDSFLSAAAFQQTTEVLTKAALAGASDPLQSLHARVIAGNLLPANVEANHP